MQKLKNKNLSRRNFIGVSGLGTASLWLGLSKQWGPRIVRDYLGEIGRPIQSAPFTPTPAQWSSNAITATWLGHATVLVNFYGLNILTDPVLFPRIGAGLPFGTVGPRRFVSPALAVSQLPYIDLVLLSHAHMDHLDLPSLHSLPGGTQAVTAKETSDLLRRSPFRHVQELGWGQSASLKTAHGDIQVSAIEVNHWGARWKRDTFRGYNGYVLEREGKKVLFGGDTAMTDCFRPLRCQGPYQLAIMPIGSYNPGIRSHCTPEQSVAMANACGAEYFLPIHHRTFPLGREPRTEPLQRLEQVLEKDRIALTDIGQTFQLS